MDGTFLKSDSVLNLINKNRYFYEIEHVLHFMFHLYFCDLCRHNINYLIIRDNTYL